MNKKIAPPVQNAISIENEVIGNIKDQYLRKSLRGQQSVMMSPALVVGDICLAFQRGVAYGKELKGR